MNTNADIVVDNIPKQEKTTIDEISELEMKCDNCSISIEVCDRKCQMPYCKYRNETILRILEILKRRGMLG